MPDVRHVLPHRAIAKYAGEDGSIGVTHRPVDCVKCRCCTDICPEGALELSDEVLAVDLLSGAQERYPMKPLKNRRATRTRSGTP